MSNSNNLNITPLDNIPAHLKLKKMKLPRMDIVNLSPKKICRSEDQRNEVLQKTNDEEIIQHLSHSWTLSGFNGLRACRSFWFTADFGVFNELVEATYHQLCTMSPQYTQNISMGMFMYYCGVALWYRLYAIRYAQGGDSSWMFSVMKCVMPDQFALPKPICEFLDAVGDFTEPSGVFWKLTFPDLNEQIHFGRMAASSFYKYMAYPAPAVLVGTLQQELDVFTSVKVPYSSWRLPSIDYEGCPSDAVFNENVCGYYIPPRAAIYAVTPDDVIIQQLANALKILTDPNVSLNPPWVVPELLTYISDANVTLIEDYFMEKNYKNESNFGSIVQIGFVKFTAKTEHDTPSTLNDVLGCSSFHISDDLSKLIPVFRLRADRVVSLKSYPYNFKNHKAVPPYWSENINANFNNTYARKRLNLPVFCTSCVDRQLAVAQYVESFSEES
nr:PREDICTED: uncharacterized protein LOC109042040 isoform X1 [Bemisia tabaci]